MTNNARSVPSVHPDADASQLLHDEVAAHDKTQRSLDSQLREMGARFDRERHRARELTSNLVAARRDDERHLLASDEAVSHALTAQHDEAIEALRALKERPYFARVVLEEEEASGAVRNVEYKIGYSANPDCRIIDWRKAPLSRLYYEYQEGEDYCEEIQGRERSGRIALRNRVEITKGVLEQVSCRYGTYRLSGEGWRAVSGGAVNARDFGSLPDVLALISPEQFRAITRDAGDAVLIQGVAGSGKTTVALHRLSWLLDKDNGDVKPDDCVVLTLGPSLRQYIRSSLDALGMPSVKAFSYREWCAAQIGSFVPPGVRRSDRGLPELTPSSSKPPSGVERVKRSMALLRTLEAVSQQGMNRQATNPFELLLAALSDPRRIKENDETRLLNDDLIRAALHRTQEMQSRGTLDRSDFSLLLRAAQLCHGPAYVASRARPYRHIIIDEVQDYSPVELATVLSVVEELGNLTLVGDTTQRVEDGFPGWEKLRKWWTARKVQSSFVRLEVSHRSTQEIVACAAAVGGLEAPKGGRRGERPRWMFSLDSDRALVASIDWLQRITRLAPHALVGVVCFSAVEAKEVYALLAPTFGPLIRLGDDSAFSFEEGIVVCEAYAAKGLEFYGVLVWQPLSSQLPKGEVGRNLLYIASTRAQEHLAFVSSGKGSSPLSACSERIVDKIDLDLVDDDEVEEVEIEDS